MLLIYSSRNSERLDYTCKFIFAEYYGIPFRICTDESEFFSWSGAKLNYSNSIFENAVQIKPYGLLFETGIKAWEEDVFHFSGFHAFFKTDAGEVPFDLFSSVFFMLSRYEEYLPNIPDLHGRYKAESSLAYRYGFLLLPVVEVWLQWFRQILQARFPLTGFSQRQFRSISTVDVDQAFCYRHKGAFRNISGLFRDAIRMDIHAVTQRIKVLGGKEADPYDNFTYLLAVAKISEVPLIIFFLLSTHGKFDKGISPAHPAMQIIVKHMHAAAATGIHPSYNSPENPELMKTEISRLQGMTGAAVTKSRQHYLRLKIPGTYRNLIANGIQEDHTMGYASSPGFRAGISVPFHFYDLINEKETNLLLQPFTVMDVTLRNYLKLDPECAIQLIGELIGQLKKVNGTFVSLWHNESLAEVPHWKGWRKVYEEMMKMASINQG